MIMRFFYFFKNLSKNYLKTFLDILTDFKFLNLSFSFIIFSLFFNLYIFSFLVIIDSSLENLVLFFLAFFLNAPFSEALKKIYEKFIYNLVF